MIKPISQNRMRRRTAGAYIVFETTLEASINIDRFKEELRTIPLLGPRLVNAYVDSSGLALTVMVNMPAPAKTDSLILAALADHDPAYWDTVQQAKNDRLAADMESFSRLENDIDRSLRAIQDELTDLADSDSCSTKVIFMGILGRQQQLFEIIQLLARNRPL